ncbi:ABC transporter substrate-binding protein [Eoetvoesiella caeni]|uniref:ABC transporter substrate-binding protein n=1 Tax=Eoetvoesiella caeni TaxID=645616 RepID=UPI0014737130|nr:ABC transporter substrate-binding protein [Eoetvoesiella caeni]MCI2810991.1 ABC transporter substrate-binding protein [Eoetvoesiella caeni]NYT56889.1 ABC transporter substrate-binding protein [Eoetvoesiella caeni]
MANDKEVVVGFAVAQSGMFQPYDAEGIEMANLYLDELNKRGGVLGHRVRSVIADTRSDRVEGAKAGASVVSQGAKLVVVTCDYDFGAPAALQANRNEIIAVSLCAGDPKMGPAGLGPYVFSAGMAGQSEGVKAADWAFTQRGFKTAYMLTDTHVQYNSSVCAGFEWQWEKLGGKMAGKDTFRNGDPSVASQVTRMRNAIRDDNVDVVMLCTLLPGGATALRQIRAADIETPIISGQAMSGTFWMDSVPNLSDFYTIQQAAVNGDPRESVQKVSKLYADTLGKEITQPSVFGIYAWLDLWVKAVETAGTFDSDAVLKVMNGYTNEPTFLGPYSFTPELHIQDAPEQVIVEIQDGKQAQVILTEQGESLPTNLLYRISN